MQSVDVSLYEDYVWTVGCLAHKFGVVVIGCCYGADVVLLAISYLLFGLTHTFARNDALGDILAQSGIIYKCMQRSPIYSLGTAEVVYKVYDTTTAKSAYKE
jgi:hypothetical protein